MGEQEKVLIENKRGMLFHFTYCSSMVTFRTSFRNFWKKCFNETLINDVVPIAGIRNTANLQRQLVRNK